MSIETKHLLRAMAWQRAKGELLSIMETYVEEGRKSVDMSKAFMRFVEEVESKGLVE